MGDKDKCSDCEHFSYDYFMDAEEEIDIFECGKGHNDRIGWGKQSCWDFEPKEGPNGTNC